MYNIEELQVIKDNYCTNWTVLNILKNKLVDSGQISQVDLNHLFSVETNVIHCDTAQIALVYQTIYELDQHHLPNPSYFFAPSELESSLALSTTHRHKGDECVFEDCYMISPHKEFGCFVTLNQIYQLSESRELRILSGMQRE